MREPSVEADTHAKSVFEAALEVHRTLGPDFLESAYEKAIEVDFRARGIEYERQKSISVRYKGVAVGETRLDFLVGEIVIVELKATDTLHPIHHAQVLSYLN